MSTANQPERAPTRYEPSDRLRDHAFDRYAEAVTGKRPSYQTYEDTDERTRRSQAQARAQAQGETHALLATLPDPHSESPDTDFNPPDPAAPLPPHIDEHAAETDELIDPYPDAQTDPQPDPQAEPEAVIAAYSDEALLHALAIYDFNPLALAEHLNISPFALLDFCDSDPIQSKLERYHAFERQMLELRSFQSKRLTIEGLEHVLETTEDLVEKRRTATTLHRVLNGLNRTNSGGTGGRTAPGTTPGGTTPGGTNSGGTDLRDVRAPSNRSTSINNPSPRSATTAEPQSASDNKQHRASDRGHAEPRSASDKKQHRVSDHGTPEPPTPSPSSDASVIVSLSEPPSESEREEKPVNESASRLASDQTEPQRGSDHWDDKQAGPPAELTPTPRSDQNNKAAKPPFDGSANAEPPSVSEPDGTSASESKENPAGARAQDPSGEPTNDAPEIDWDAFTTWPKPTDTAETDRALRASTGAPKPEPHQRE